MLLEEFQLYGRNLRGFVGQNILRIATAGRNRRLRILGVTTDLSLIDPLLVRLCGQRYHARLGIEDNAKRKFRGYYGLDWCRIATELKLGTFIYLTKERLRIVSVPRFETRRTPKPFIPEIIVHACMHIETNEGVVRMIYLIFWVIIIPVAFYLAWRDTRKHWRLVELGIQQRLQEMKGEKRKEIIFVDDLGENLNQCDYCGKEINREEYKRERQGYCDECTDNLLTEEEEELWGM